VKEKRSATTPVIKVARSVPVPAAVPAMPATVATVRLWKRSAGRVLAMVDIAAYENVATAKHARRRDVARGEGRGDEREDAQRPARDHEAARAPDRPPAANEPAGDGAAEEVAEAGAENGTQ
jgi:hypothetical protein